MSELLDSHNSAAKDDHSADDARKKVISMAVKVDESIASDFRKMAKETGMEQGAFLQAMLDNFRLNEDKTLYREHAEDIQTMRDLTATINYKYVALIAQNKIAEEKAHARDAQHLAELETEIRTLREEKKEGDAARQRCALLEHEYAELKETVRQLENRIEQMTSAHKNEIDALVNKHNAAITDMAQSYAEKYMRFVEDNTEIHGKQTSGR